MKYKTLLLFMATICVCYLFPSEAKASFYQYEIGGYETTDAIEIKLNSEYPVQIDKITSDDGMREGARFFTFTPIESGYYYCYTQNAKETVSLAMYSKENESDQTMTRSDYGVEYDENNQYTFYYLEAGKTYCWAAGYASCFSTGTYSVCLKKYTGNKAIKILSADGYIVEGNNAIEVKGEMELKDGFTFPFNHQISLEGYQNSNGLSNTNKEILLQQRKVFGDEAHKDVGSVCYYCLGKDYASFVKGDSLVLPVRVKVIQNDKVTCETSMNIYGVKLHDLLKKAPTAKTNMELKTIYQKDSFSACVGVLDVEQEGYYAVSLKNKNITFGNIKIYMLQESDDKKITKCDWNTISPEETNCSFYFKKGKQIIVCMADVADASYIVGKKIDIMKKSAEKLQLPEKTVVVLKEKKNLADQLVVIPESYVNEVEWSSSNEKVATVTNGVVKGLSVGKTTITAMIGSKKASCEVSVLGKNDVKKNAAIVFTEGVINKKVGDECFVNGMQVMTDGRLTFTSSDKKIAIVDEKGMVTIKGAGTVTITVQSAMTDYYKAGKASYTLHVKKGNPVLKVTNLKKSIKVEKLKKKNGKIKAVKISGTDGKASFTKKSGSRCLTINKKTGKITVKKGTKKGKYSMKIVIKTSESMNYYAAKKTAKVTVTVK